MKGKKRQESKKHYLYGEMLKYRHTAVGKLMIFMPLVCVALSASLTHKYFSVDGYNWWYVMMYPGMIALVCSIISGKDKRLGNRAVWSLPCDMKRVWDGKVMCGVIVSGLAVVSLTLFILGVSYFLRTTLNFTFLINPTIKTQIMVCVILWVSFCWQIPYCLMLSQKMGRIPMLLIHMIGYAYMAYEVSLTPYYMWIPGANAPRMMCVLLGIMPNGLIARPGEMMYTPELLQPESVPIGLISSVIWFLLLWGISRKWYERQVEKA